MAINCHHGRLPYRSGGFTLIEVLLAFLVFALSFTVVLEILSGAMRNTTRAKQNTEVALIAQSVMDQVGMDIPLESGVSNRGEFGEYVWELQINSYDPTEDTSRFVDLGELTGLELLEIEFIIMWGKGSRERSHRFTTVKAVLANRLGGRSET